MSLRSPFAARITANCIGQERKSTGGQGEGSSHSNWHGLFGAPATPAAHLREKGPVSKSEVGLVEALRRGRSTGANNGFVKLVRTWLTALRQLESYLVCDA